MFENALRRYVRDHGIKISWLATHSKMKYYSLWSSLKGERELRANEVASICKALDISMDDLNKLDSDHLSLEEADDA